MFKKLKDKLAEEVKSSPQRIQQFAQAAQAAVTSASSSISDITNSDLFSIGDNDGQQPRPARSTSSETQQNTFQDVALMQTATESMDFSHEIADGQRQRRLSNSSFASDVSFRLPSYETPSMYHLQSDMEVSASEADDRGFAGGPATLDRVTKEQLYAAYKRTQERYKKYRTQYGDLARHYKLLERENAKARSVLVETQDKALRRISELKEQCSLEQSAKAHLEKALRVELEEKSMKIEALNTKIQFLQNDTSNDCEHKNDNTVAKVESEKVVQLINLDAENVNKPQNDDSGSEVINLNNKIEKMEQLLNKYKDSLKASKEKNAQINTELQILSKELENKNKIIVDFKATEEQLNDAKTKIQELNILNEELQNKINTFDFTKTKELSTLELDLQKANEEIAELRDKIKVFGKREEEYAISLAENKLSIHKELESKEAEIKSLKDNLTSSKKEIVSLKIIVEDYKNNISSLEEEKVKMNNDGIELRTLKNKFAEMDTTLQELAKKSQSLEQLKMKVDEEYKCLQLQLKQETAEKLAMIDRNQYLETKNTQLSEENSKKNARVSNLESDLQQLASNKDLENLLKLKETENNQLHVEMNSWKEKCGKLELEIQEEREELVKLQTEIEKLLLNHELIQTQNAEFRSKITNLTTECTQQQESLLIYKLSIKTNAENMLKDLKQLRESLYVTSEETKTNLKINKVAFTSLTDDVKHFLKHLVKDIELVRAQYNTLKLEYDNLQNNVAVNQAKGSEDFKELDLLQKENKNLKTKLNAIETETLLSKNKQERICQDYETAMNNIESISSENEELKLKLKEFEETSDEIKKKFDFEKSEHLLCTEKLKHFEKDNANHVGTIQSLEQNLSLLETKIKQIENNYKDALEQLERNKETLRIKEEEINVISTQNYDNRSSTVEQLEQLNNEKVELNEKYKILENNNIKLIADIEDLTKKHKETAEQINKLNIELNDKIVALEKSEEIQISLEKDLAEYEISLAKSYDTVAEHENVQKDLTEKLKSFEDKNKVLEGELEGLKEQYKTASDKIEEVTSIVISKTKECDILSGKLKSFEDKTQILGEELECLKNQYKSATDQIEEVNSILIHKTQECEDKHKLINELGECVHTLTQENIALKTETASFASNIKHLETEINDIKISHAEIETEKDRLNYIIEQLENKQKEHSVVTKNDKDIQTESNNKDKSPIEESATVLENKWVKEHKQTAMTSTASLNLKKEEVYEQYSTLRINYDSLKEDNRRLQSDIDGLQSYLTKISKENSVLNDKLRESIASSEHSADSEQLSSDVNELRSEIQTSKETINDLQRENSLLIEENLELKDQLQSQSYSEPTETKTVLYSKGDLELMKVKYNDLMQANSQLEKQNNDLEQINKSVSGNMELLQNKNERLRLSNEKLERRLDEALVSLRHLHSLQENTELEYLRNILYEYLTGSGTHSVTLAKVLAAIVKFDDVQTQMVLQKEKERQGFLRQLGII